MDAGGLVSFLVTAAVVFGLPAWRRMHSRRKTSWVRVQRPAAEFEADVDAVAADIAGKPLDAIYREGITLVQPFVTVTDFRLDAQRFGRGLALLEHVVCVDPTNWAAMWMLGRGYRRARSFARSHDLLARAHALAPDRLEAVVEYQQACLLLGRTDEALPLAHRYVAMTGGNADSHSNLAVTLLLHGEIDAAATEAAAAAELAPDDAVILRVRTMIADVRAGRRVRPRSLLDLDGSVGAPVGETLTPEDAQRAFDEAYAAYRSVLEADANRVLTKEERARVEQSTGPIQRVEVRATAVDLTWHGRTLRPELTERTTIVGPKGSLWREGRLQMVIQARDEGWRVIQARLLPLLQRPEASSGPTVIVPGGLPN